MNAQSDPRIENLQADIHRMEMQILAQMNDALLPCRSQFEREQCRSAYYALMRNEQDIIGQRYGLPPMLRRSP